MKTRSKSKPKELEAHRHGEAAPENHDSGAVWASVPQNRQRNNVEVADSGQVPARRKRGRPKGSGRKKNGNTSAAMDMGGIEPIDEAEFYRSKKRRTESKVGHSATARQEEHGEGSSPATGKRNVEGVGHGSDQQLPAQKGNDNEDVDSEEDIDKLVEEEFRKFRIINLDSSSEEEPGEGFVAGSPRKDDNNGANPEWPHKSSPFVHRGSNGEDIVPREIEVEEIDGEELINQTRQSELKKGESLEEHFDSNPSAEKDEHFTFEDPRRGSDEAQTDKARSFSEKGNNIEEADPDELEIIDGSEFMKRTHFGTKVRSSTEQGLDGVHIASTSQKKVKGVGKKKREVLFYSSSDSYDEPSSSDPSTEFSSDSNSTYLPDDEISSDGASLEADLGAKGRTRSKKGSAKEPEEVSNLGSPLNLDSQHNEAEGTNSVHGAEELCTNDMGCDVRNNIPIEEDCTKQQGSVAKRAPIRRRQNPCNKESNSEQLTSKKGKFTFRKRQLSNEPSAKQKERRKAHKTSVVHKEERNKTSGNDRSEPKSTCPEKSYAQNDDDEANRDNEQHPNDQSQAGITMQTKEASSSHSKDDCNNNDDDTYDGEDEEEDEDEEKEEDQEDPTRSQQLFSNQYDFCSRIADSILGDGPLFETTEIYEEVMREFPSPNESSLPLKFKFEDVEPKEVEETGYEKEVGGLFSEFDVDWALEELGSSNYPPVNEENENPLAQETHHDRCTRGEHVLILRDDQGLICIYCNHVALGPKHILPEWAKKVGISRKRCKEAAEPLDFDELHFQPSVKNAATFDYSADGTVWSLKAGIRESMYEHQREGFEFLWKNLAGSIKLEELKSNDSLNVGGCIISHAPGTGKTRLTINFIETYLTLFPNCKPVIIGPASMLLTWEEEFRKWNVGFPFYNLNNWESAGPELKAALTNIQGVSSRNKDARRMINLKAWSQGRSILGISYSLFEKSTGEKYLRGKNNQGEKALHGIIKKMRRILLEMPGLVVMDEGHTPRNQRSNIWNALLKLKTEKRVILSGTPFQNNFGELFNTLHLVRPASVNVFTQERSFAEMIASRRVSKKHNHSQDSLDKLKGVMVPFVHVHKGTILQQSLPGLRDCVILLKPSALQKSLIERLEGSSTFEFEHRVALISVHPYLLVHIPKDQRIKIDMAAIEKSRLDPNEGVKIKFILELVRLSTILKEKVLIFSQFIQPLELIKEHLKECFSWADGKEILQMVGKLEQKQRQVMINAFNDSKNESKVMLGSTRCCSEGISLVGASRVVLLDVVWNPSVERQAISRAYRIGQKKFVYTYHLMTSGTTEADKYCRQAEKERLSELVFTSSSNESNNQKQPCLSIEDRVLEQMVGQERLKDMFDKIINQPKEIDLFQTFGLN